MPVNRNLWLGFLIATACVIYMIESLIMRFLPMSFLRLGLSNIIILHLVTERQYKHAFVVNIAKSLIGGFFTYTLISPATMLSISGGIAALLVMMAAKSSKLGFSIYGISIAGAVLHNLTQLALVKYAIIPNVQVFVLTPILLLLGMVSGIVVAYLTLIFRDKIKDLRLT